MAKKSRFLVARTLLLALFASSQTRYDRHGPGNDTTFANLCLLRYSQVKLEGYRQLIVQTADRYVCREPDLSVPLHPGTFGNLIFLMVGTHDITGEEKYLASAEDYVDTAIGLFLDDSPLPKATSRHDHYEAVTPWATR